MRPSAFSVNNYGQMEMLSGGLPSQAIVMGLLGSLPKAKDHQETRGEKEGES